MADIFYKDNEPAFIITLNKLLARKKDWKSYKTHLFK